MPAVHPRKSSFTGCERPCDSTRPALARTQIFGHSVRAIALPGADCKDVEALVRDLQLC